MFGIYKWLLTAWEKDFMSKMRKNSACDVVGGKNVNKTFYTDGLGFGPLEPPIPGSPKKTLFPVIPSQRQ